MSRFANASGIRGFTLLEMMIALMIVGVVSALAMSAYVGYTETASQAAMRNKIESFRLFQDSYRVDSGTYLAGTYDPANNVNDFEALLGFRIPGDEDGVKLVVTACDGGVIADCYKVTATDLNGHTAVWNDGVFE